MDMALSHDETSVAPPPAPHRRRRPGPVPRRAAAGVRPQRLVAQPPSIANRRLAPEPHCGCPQLGCIAVASFILSAIQCGVVVAVCRRVCGRRRAQEHPSSGLLATWLRGWLPLSSLPMRDRVGMEVGDSHVRMVRSRLRIACGHARFDFLFRYRGIVGFVLHVGMHGSISFFNTGRFF
jgi:hypothetical protein